MEVIMTIPLLKISFFFFLTEAFRWKFFIVKILVILNVCWDLWMKGAKETPATLTLDNRIFLFN